ncbi:pantetheine-phosphate adenylyltransferase [Christensenellaceae bacterium OttesenSCG-928-L17]|nr:pantetheine-phosphate adenylyltransferase [Christensenellaceae bacterium OttesenSCG-928-L17]
MKTGIYPGSFDPFTNGHMDILLRASALLDRVVVATLINSAKEPFFSMEERVQYIKNVIAAHRLQNVEVGRFDGLLVNYARKEGAQYIIRGLRAVTDFEYEFQIGAMNRKLAPDVETIYFMAEAEHAYISSSVVREIGMLGGSIDTLVPEINKSSIIERLTKR